MRDYRAQLQWWLGQSWQRLIQHSANALPASDAPVVAFRGIAAMAPFC